MSKYLTEAAKKEPIRAALEAMQAVNQYAELNNGLSVTQVLADRDYGFELSLEEKSAAFQLLSSLSLSFGCWEYAKWQDQVSLFARWLARDIKKTEKLRKEKWSHLDEKKIAVFEAMDSVNEKLGLQYGTGVDVFLDELTSYDSIKAMTLEQSKTALHVLETVKSIQAFLKTLKPDDLASAHGLIRDHIESTERVNG